MKKEGLPELPPGYVWGTLSYASDLPVIRRTDNPHAALYYRPELRHIRYRNNSSLGFTSILKEMSEEEAFAIMIQMAWLGEI